MNSKDTLTKIPSYTEKFHMLNEDQKFVNQMLDKLGLEIKWLAEKIHIEYDILRYQLREATNYRQDVHARIMDVFRKEGIVTSNKEVCDKLKDELIDFAQILTGTVALLTKSVKQKINDRNLDETEKRDLKDQIRTQQRSVNDEFNDMLITIDLK